MADASPAEAPPPSASMTTRLIQLYDSIKKTLFILGTALLVFVCARNTITWHLQRIWGASGDFWQTQWSYLYDFCGKNEPFISVWGTFMCTMSVFWLSNLFLMILDTTGWPAGLVKYKIQPDKNCPLSMRDLARAVKLVLFNQFCVGLPMLFLIHLVTRWRGCPVRPDDLPTFHWAVLELTVFSLVEEVGFYYSHRLLHHPRVYKYIHKVHHEWTASIGIVSIYAHPVEHILSNIIPPALGPVLMGSHVATMWLWFAIALMSTTVAHSGYHFPFLPSPEAHDYHHRKFNQNFGVLGVLDRFHGTDSQFRASKSYERHFLLLSMVPVSQTFPESPKKKPE